MAQPPPLPPRARPSSPSATSATSSQDSPATRPRTDMEHLTPYSYARPDSAQDVNRGERPLANQWHVDPRSSSMQSIRPIESAGTNRRTLLLVYIHGFMGDETSFRSFPAHIHNQLTLFLAESHVIYTKIYPKYKSRRDISFARDDFSNWLCPHESSSTDVILFGHSLGGILAAEVALLESNVTGSLEHYQHRILGVVAFDTPFLGMHPGVVSTGIASLFRPSPEIPSNKSPERVLAPVTSSASGSVSSPSESLASDPFSLVSGDPNYDPRYPNDVVLPDRGSKLQKAWYFWNKHYGELTKASKAYFTSHLEFGGCLMDYPGLRKRYNAIRSLEDIDELSKPQDSSGRLLHRVRFVNYYSASTGRIKETAEDITAHKSDEPLEQEMKELSLQQQEVQGSKNDRARSSVDSVKLSTDDGSPETYGITESDSDGLEEMTDLGPPCDPYEETISPLCSQLPPTDSEMMTSLQVDGKEQQLEEQEVAADDNDNDLPPIPPLPKPPSDFDASRYSAKDTLKVAQKEHDRQVKAFERAKKDRERSIKDREKMLLKRRRAIVKQQAKEAKIAKQQDTKAQEKLKRSATLNPEVYDKQLKREAKEMAATGKPPKSQRDRNFCSLPSKDTNTGLRDPTWIRVYMEGVDEVVAHTTLFLMSDTYEKLVGDTAMRIESWVHEDAMKNAALAQSRSWDDI